MEQLPLFRPPAPTSWSVSELNRYIKDLLESDHNLADVWVQGEISNFSQPRSGHLYFTLKDGGAALRCVMWRNAAIRLPSLPRDGDAVEVHGAVSVYEAGGQYQLYVDRIRPRGEGVLFQEFLRLKAKLEAEGLFDEARKRPIPARPQRIGIVTSPTGAALRDMLNTLRRRYPLVEVILAPSPVQGEEAPAGILKALHLLNTLVKPDVILLARGGGSIEDLWAFNHEAVARAITLSDAPVISGVGHQTDFTIADFVADLRAPTPTAAAELATPDRLDLADYLAELSDRLSRIVQTQTSTLRWACNDLAVRLARNSPVARIQSDRQHLDELSNRAARGLFHHLQLQHAQLRGLERRLAALNPQAILQRGFAIITLADGSLVSRVSQAHPGERLSVRLSDGKFSAQVLDEPPEGHPSP
jgi:exodeoxyribonuclease VII large subunit